MLKKILINLVDKFGYEVHQKNKIKLPDDFEQIHREVWNYVKEKTMTSPERIYSLIEAVKYIEKNNIEGDIVECGVWRGGSMMAVAKTLLQMSSTKRKLYLYDTFDGMPPPSKEDKAVFGKQAEEMLYENNNKEENLVWAYSGLDEVKSNMDHTKYPGEKIHYCKGKVEETIPATIPNKIALLRLDTDWYESTKHELEYLFPLLSDKGILIIDDYGFWQGARKAVDEYFSTFNPIPYLSRVDGTGRIMVK